MLTDIFGKRIHAGDFIMYPGRYSSSLWMNIAFVTHIHDGKGGHLRVNAIRLDYGDDTAKKTTCKMVHRAVVMLREVVPQKYIDALEEPLIREKGTGQ